MSGWMGVDLAALRPRRADRQRRLQRHPVRGQGVPVRRPRRRRVGRARHRRLGQDRRHGTAASSAPVTSVADALQEWVDETDVDGFNLAYAITPGSFADFVDHVVPVLTERGAYQPEYAPGTLRNKLFGRRRPAARRAPRRDATGSAAQRSTIIERPSTVPSSSASVASQPTSRSLGYAAMSVKLHWFLPTYGDSRLIVGGGHGTPAGRRAQRPRRVDRLPGLDRAGRRDVRVHRRADPDRRVVRGRVRHRRAARAGDHVAGVPGGVPAGPGQPDAVGADGGDVRPARARAASCSTSSSAARPTSSGRSATTSTRTRATSAATSSSTWSAGCGPARR